MCFFFFFSSRRRHTRCALVTGVQTCALPIAGVSYTRKFVKKARDEGWADATAAQVRPDGEGTKLDWNDLLLRHEAYKGDPDYAPFSDKLIEEYLWNEIGRASCRDRGCQSV